MSAKYNYFIEAREDDNKTYRMTIICIITIKLIIYPLLNVSDQTSYYIYHRRCKDGFIQSHITNGLPIYAAMDINAIWC